MTTIERGALAALAALLAQAFVDDLSTRPAITLTGAALAGLLLSRPATPTSRTGTIAVAAARRPGVGCRGDRGLRRLRRSRRAAARPTVSGAAGAAPRALSFGARCDPMGGSASQSISSATGARGRSRTTPPPVKRPSTRKGCSLRTPSTRAAPRVSRPRRVSRSSRSRRAVERAIRLYDHAADLARWDATIPLEASRFLLQVGDPGAARRSAELALRIEPRAAAPRLCLARAILSEEGAAGAGRARQLLDEAETGALPRGERPSSPYDAALRSIDPGLRDSIRRDLGD